MNVAVVFDGSGANLTTQADPHDVQVFYAPRGQSADAIIERLASKYSSRFDITVATSDSLVKETVNASGAAFISPETLLGLLQETGQR